MSGARGTGSRIPTTENHRSPSHTRGRPTRSSMPSRAAASEPSTTVGYSARASSRNRPSATEPPSVGRSSGSVATTAMPPVTASSIRSVRRTVTGTVRVAAADSTGPMRRIMLGAVDGSSVSSPKADCPADTCRRLVPRLSSSASRSARLDAEMPITLTIAAMPTAMPSAVSAVRPRRERSPSEPTAARSGGRSRLGDGAVGGHGLHQVARRRTRCGHRGWRRTGAWSRRWRRRG